MRRFWIDSSCLQKDTFILKDSLHHHVCRVCQIQKGEPFQLLMGGSKKYTVALTSVSSFRAVAQIIEEHPPTSLPKPYIHLALCLPRFSKLDFIVEKSVELGVKSLHPLVSSFSFIRKPSEFSLTKQKRLKKIVQQALAVSGRTEEFEVFSPCFLKDIAIPKGHKAFMAYEGESCSSFQKALQAEKTQPENIWLFIGSEGGFTSQEAQHFCQSLGELVSFGDRILRVETACLFGLSALKYHYHI